MGRFIIKFFLFMCLIWSVLFIISKTVYSQSHQMVDSDSPQALTHKTFDGTNTFSGLINGDASTLLNKTWASPGGIGSNIPSSGAFTSVTTQDLITKGPWVDVRAFGVTTANSVSVNDANIAAMMAVAPSGSEIKFSERGVYKISATIPQINGNFYTFSGYGGYGNAATGSAPLTVIQWVGGSLPMLIIPTASDGTRIRDLTFENAGTASSAIYVNGTYHVTLDHVSLEVEQTHSPFSEAALVLDGTLQDIAFFLGNKVTIKGHNTTPGTSIGILSKVTANVVTFRDSNVIYHQTNFKVAGTISSLTWDGGNNEILNASGSSGRGFYINSGQAVNIIHTHFETEHADQRSIEFNSVTSGSIRDNFFNGGVGTPSDYLITSLNSTSKNVTVEGNTFANVTIAALQLTASTNWKLGKNTLATGATAILPSTTVSTLVLSNGANNNVVLPQIPQVVISGPTGAFSISGVAGGKGMAGQDITIFNGLSFNCTISHENGSSTNFNRIWTASGSDIILPANGSVTLRWMFNLERWLVISSSAVSTGSIITSTLATGTAPLSIASTTPVVNLNAFAVTYSSGGTQQTNVHIVQDTCTLGTNCSVTLSGSAVFTSLTSYTCIAQDNTGIFATLVAQSSGSAFAITGNGTDVIRYTCIGN